MTSTATPADLIAAADAAFAAGDADRYADLYLPTAHLYLLHREALDGRDAVRAHWRDVFGRFDTSAWEPVVELVDTHETDAYAFVTYTERLRSRADGAGTLVRGRLVYFMRETPDGWRIRLLMNSHSHPTEPIA